MTRLWPAGQPITVACENRITNGERPLHFTWDGQKHHIIEITRIWRVDIDWWRGRIWRAYFKLRTDTGLLTVIFQDLLSGNWYLQRLFD